MVDVKLSVCFNCAPCHKGVLGSGRLAPRILEVSGQLHATAALPKGKIP
jgi:hypothetical protein